MNDRPLIFRDRADAGRQLAERLLRYRGENPVVLALPRGGVPVGLEVAKALDAPLDIVLVRKIGAPWQPELALGAVADGDSPETFLNEDILRELGMSAADVQSEANRQLAEIERRRQVYLQGRPPVPLAGRTALVVDDGIATGATTHAALRSVRRRGPRRIVLATPVAPADTLARLRQSADDVVCLSAPALFGAISVFYENFAQVSDEEVIAMLKLAQPQAQAAGSVDPAQPKDAAAARKSRP